MNRKPFIAGNWKMNKNNSEAVKTAKKLTNLLKNIDNKKDVMIAPTFISLNSVSEVIKKSKIKLGAQNMSFEKSGAYTGEISSEMLLSVGCEYVILGHSERRHIFNETDNDINKKVRTAIKYGIKPILCIGEKKEERDAKKTFDVLDKQLLKGIDNIVLNYDFIIAYEPVWAIGTGDTATEKQVDEVHKFLRKKINNYLEDAKQVRILYGGSVSPKNIKNLMKIEDVDGVLVGGASLEPETFFKIINH